MLTEYNGCYKEYALEMLKHVVQPMGCGIEAESPVRICVVALCRTCSG